LGGKLHIFLYFLTYVLLYSNTFLKFLTITCLYNSLLFYELIFNYYLLLGKSFIIQLLISVDLTPLTIFIAHT